MRGGAGIIGGARNEALRWQRRSVCASSRTAAARALPRMRMQGLSRRRRQSCSCLKERGRRLQVSSWHALLVSAAAAAVKSCCIYAKAGKQASGAPPRLACVPSYPLKERRAGAVGRYLHPALFRSFTLLLQTCMCVCQ